MKCLATGVNERLVLFRRQFVSGARRVDRTELLEERQVRFMVLDIYRDIAVSTAVYGHDRARQQRLKKRAPLPGNRAHAQRVTPLVVALDALGCCLSVNVTSESPEVIPVGITNNPTSMPRSQQV